MRHSPRIAQQAVALAAAACFSLSAFAQTYPQKTVRIVSPTGPSGGADTQARLVAKRFTESMGQPFFVDNRPGYSGVIGTDALTHPLRGG